MNNKNMISIVGFVITCIAFAIIVINKPNFDPEPEVSRMYAEHYGRQTEILREESSTSSVLFGKRVLLFGDSQAAGAPGRVLQNYVMAEGATHFFRSGRVGWGVRRWYSIRGQILSMFNRQQPDIVVVMLGGNDWPRAENPNYPLLVREFWDHINVDLQDPSGHVHHPYICWVAPVRVIGPRSAGMQPKREMISEIIEHVVGEEHFIQSNDITGDFGRSADGVHFTYAGARRWIHDLNDRIKSCVSNQQDRQQI